MKFGGMEYLNASELSEKQDEVQITSDILWTMLWQLDWG